MFPLRIRRRSSKGFTLIELLTVISIIIILMGFILTAVWAAQESGRLALCKNNLGQLHQLILVYTQTYGGYLPAFYHERWTGELGLVGRRWGSLHDDVFEVMVSGKLWRMPDVWDNLQGSDCLKYVTDNGQPAKRMLFRSGAPILTCKSDLTSYRSDQGALVSYMGLAKYGWWHRGDVNAANSMFLYRQIQEIPNPSRGILLSESEPATWVFGNCGCRWHVYNNPDYIVQRHFGGGNILHFDGGIKLAKTERERQIITWDPDYADVNPANEGASD